MNGIGQVGCQSSFNHLDLVSFSGYFHLFFTLGNLPLTLKNAALKLAACQEPRGWRCFCELKKAGSLPHRTGSAFSSFFQF
jgi:hypothetical protein